MKDLSNMSLVQHTNRNIQQKPPFIYLRYPMSISLGYIIGELGSHVHIAAWQPTLTMGEALLELTPAIAADRLYGCVVPCGQLGTATLTCGDATGDRDSMTTQELNVEDALLS